MGPILPQVNVFGKDLGISPDIMGLITSILPILYVLAKPGVGFLIDYFPVSMAFNSFQLTTTTDVGTYQFNLSFLQTEQA